MILNNLTSHEKILESPGKLIMSMLVLMLYVYSVIVDVEKVC